MSLRYVDLESFAKHIMSKKPNPTLISTKAYGSIKHFLSTDGFKDMPLWKISKLFADDKEEHDIDFRDDLQYIESTLADEFSLLFYIGLLRENNHEASDYPLTVGFIRSSPNMIYPKDSLLDIVRGDGKIRKQLVEWIREATTYQRLACEKMNRVCLELEN